MSYHLSYVNLAVSYSNHKLSGTVAFSDGDNSIVQKLPEATCDAIATILLHDLENSLPVMGADLAQAQVGFSVLAPPPADYDDFEEVPFQ